MSRELIPHIFEKLHGDGRPRCPGAPYPQRGSECRMAQEALRYPPYGNASCCRSNHADGFEAKNWMKYLDHVQELVFVPMIEDPKQLDTWMRILDELKARTRTW